MIIKDYISLNRKTAIIESIYRKYIVKTGRKVRRRSDRSLYKDRWEIEVFFKTLKQHLKVKTFIGTSENALRIQIWTALIALLFLKYLHHLSKANWSLSNLATMLRLNLFTYRDLTEWINDPFGSPLLK